MSVGIYKITNPTGKIYIGQSITIENRWKEVFEYAGEWYDYFENQMIGFKNGAIYTHETNTTNLIINK